MSVARRLSELPEGAEAILESIDLPPDDARQLMMLGFLPGHRIQAALSAPGGDPRVYRVDGSEVALRQETAAHLMTLPPLGSPSGNGR
ncbi:MAG TPA: FeoA family protein [Bryobacteraceae bacterium]|nr:FeoA family protein [Bryobacteraceae bacterium]